MKILVADDDIGSRLVAQAVVEGLGHECVTASDGDEAWEQIAAFAPDVLVTDRDMPGMDGVTLCRRIRAEQEDGYTYIVLLTALGHPDEVLAGMHAGADDYITKPLNPFDLQTRLLAAARVTALHTALAAARTELGHLAHTDPLTGLRNRLGLATDLQYLHSVSERANRKYCLAMCDIDMFKAYNDHYGHPAGDQALSAVATALISQLRRGDQVYRFGGEEFLVLLPEQDLGGAAIALERVRSHLHTLSIEHEGAGPGRHLSISVGIASSSPAHRPPVDGLIAEADQALYRAKRTGRDRIVLADSGIASGDIADDLSA